MGERVEAGARSAADRYVVLDSLRGICAFVVAFYHLQTTGIITNSAFIRNGWLFVDFFFVLSGFVIASSYGDRLARGYSIGKFMLLRLGRIYPLHVFMLLAYLALELAGAAYGSSAFSAREPFTDSRTIPALFSNLGLVQIFGFHQSITWNGPSWSIAAEMWTYLLAAIAIVTFRGRLPAILVVAAIVCGVLLATVGDRYLERTFSFGLVRCLFGFSIGMLAFHLHRSSAASKVPGRLAMMTVLEVAIAAACVVAVAAAGIGPLSLACPVLFAFVVLVFAREGGLVSRALCVRPMVLLGEISYSIYMVHMFVEGRFLDAMKIVGDRIGIELTRSGMIDGRSQRVLLGEGYWSDLLALVAVVAAMVTAWFTWRLIEVPFRDRSRRFVAGMGDRPATTPKSALAERLADARLRVSALRR